MTVPSRVLSTLYSETPTVGFSGLFLFSASAAYWDDKDEHGTVLCLFHSGILQALRVSKPLT